MTAATTAPRHVAPGAGDTYRVIGDLVTFKAVGAETGGAYSLFEGCNAPGSGVPPHVERYEDETFYVLEGSYAFMLDGQMLELGPGGYAFVPRGTVHAFTNTGSTAGRVLTMLTPGGIHEQFFAELGDLVTDPSAVPGLDGPPDVQRIVAVAAKYGIDILPPPGA